MLEPGYVALHTHSEHSLLDGLANIKAMARKAAADGQRALAITDHGSMSGIVEAAQACEAAGIKLIPGIELYQAKERVSERPPKRAKKKTEAAAGDDDAPRKDKTNHHLCAWAMTDEGLRNLYRLSSFAWTSGFYFNPRVDWDTMAQHSAGIMVSTGCLGGQVLQALLVDDQAGAELALQHLVDIYGRGGVVVELQRHEIPEQDLTNPKLIELAAKFGLRTVACADSHYAEPSDAPLHDCLLCQGTNATVDQEHRFRFKGTGHHLHTQAEMARRFDWMPEAVANTLWVAEQSEVHLQFGQLHLPSFTLPQGFNTAADYLGHLAYQGALARYGTPLPAHVHERCVYELQVINNMSLADYFLITADIVAEARRRGVPVGPGRGSAAGSAISYCLGITLADPIKNGLIFERFLNPGRSHTMPDIDLDFGAERRHEMFAYIAEKYGKECVAKIGTLTRMHARTAVRDVTRVLGYPFLLGNQISNAMPPVAMGRSVPIKACLEITAGWEEGYTKAVDLRGLYNADPMARQVLDVASQLEGTVKTTGVHASAALITPGPVTNFVPLKTTKNKATGESETVTQFDLGAVDDLGLLKMDFLGLTNLDIIADTIAAVRERHGVIFERDDIPLDDPLTLELMRRGETVGVFQLESAPMRSLLRNVHPDNIEDVSAVIALYRPGPMGANMHVDYGLRKHGYQPAVPFHPDAIPLLGDTYQLMIYQEQLMEVAKTFAGYNLAEADSLRKACGKKLPAVMAKERDRFVSGCANMGYGADFGEKLFKVIERFADYAFNKAHSYCYAIIAMWTGFLKAHYGVEYMAASLTAVRTKLDKAQILLAECRRMQIELLPPDVNQSFGVFTAEGKRKIRIGLSCIRGVGDPVAALIVAERDKRGPFRSLTDYTRRMRGQGVNKGILEALIKAGAFDQLTGSRLGTLQVLEQATSYGKSRAKNDDRGQMSLLDEIGFNDEPVINHVELPRRQRLRWERELLGAWVTDHPLAGREAEIEAARDTQCAEVAELPATQKVVVVGTLTKVDRRRTKRGQMMAITAIEDFSGAVEVVVFPQAHERQGSLLVHDAVLVISGRIQRKDDGDPGNIIADSIAVLDGQVTGLRSDLAIMVATTASQQVTELISEPTAAPPVLLVVTGSRRWTEDEIDHIRAGLFAASGGRQVAGVLAGGARGADKLAVRCAQAAGVQYHEIMANWEELGEAAGHERNQQLVDMAMQIHADLGWVIQGVAFPARDSVGTWDCVHRMSARGIPVETIWRPQTETKLTDLATVALQPRVQRLVSDVWSGPICMVKYVQGGKVTGLCSRSVRGSMRDGGFTSSRAEVTCPRCLEVGAQKVALV